jgi:hypothetical protein
VNLSLLHFNQNIQETVNPFCAKNVVSYGDHGTERVNPTVCIFVGAPTKAEHLKKHDGINHVLPFSSKMEVKTTSVNLFILRYISRKNHGTLVSFCLNYYKVPLLTIVPWRSNHDGIQCMAKFYKIIIASWFASGYAWRVICLIGYWLNLSCIILYPATSYYTHVFKCPLKLASGILYIPPMLKGTLCE